MGYFCNHKEKMYNMEGEYDLPIQYSQIIHTWNIGLPETSSTQLFTTSKIQKRKCKLRKLLIGVGIIVILVMIALTAAILSLSEFNNLMEKFINKGNLTTENVRSSSIIDTKHLASRNFSSKITYHSSSSTVLLPPDIKYHGSTSNDSAEDRRNQMINSIPTTNELTIDDKGRYIFEYCVEIRE